MEGDNSVASLDPYSLTPAMVNFIAVTPKPKHGSLISGL